jgi:hypothetical protein
MNPLDQYREATFPSIAIVDDSGNELNEQDSIIVVQNVVHQMIRDSGGGTPILPNALLARVRRQAAEFFRKNSPKKRFLVSSISIDGLPKSVSVAGTEISAADRTTYPYPEPLRTTSSFVSKHIANSRYQVVSVATNEATVHQAFDIGMTTLNFVRGIWNHIETYRSSSLGFSNTPKRKWIGVAHIGPIHTLHDVDGGLDTSENYWFEPDYCEDAKIHSPRKGWDKLAEDQDWVIEQVEVSPFKHELVKLLARYAIALDQTNLDVAFLMLWSLLEKITNTVGDNYDETIKRAIWTYKDRHIAKQLLQHMRRRRNQFVHAAGSSENRDRLCYITKSFVDVHLAKLIRNEFQVTAFKDHGDFLGLPHDRATLEKKRDWYARALEFHAQRQPETDERPEESEEK